MSSATAKQRSGPADTVMRSVACSATVTLLGNPLRPIAKPGWAGPGRSSASHFRQRVGQPRSENVVIKACKRPRPRGRTHPPSQVGGFDELVERGRHVADILGAPDYVSRLAVDHRLSGTTA